MVSNNNTSYPYVLDTKKTKKLSLDYGYTCEFGFVDKYNNAKMAHKACNAVAIWQLRFKHSDNPKKKNWTPAKSASGKIVACWPSYVCEKHYTEIKFGSLLQNPMLEKAYFLKARREDAKAALIVATDADAKARNAWREWDDKMKKWDIDPDGYFIEEDINDEQKQMKLDTLKLQLDDRWWIMRETRLLYKVAQKESEAARKADQKFGYIAYATKAKIDELYPWTPPKIPREAEEETMKVMKGSNKKDKYWVAAMECSDHPSQPYKIVGGGPGEEGDPYGSHTTGYVYDKEALIELAQAILKELQAPKTPYKSKKNHGINKEWTDKELMGGGVDVTKLIQEGDVYVNETGGVPMYIWTNLGSATAFGLNEPMFGWKSIKD